MSESGQEGQEIYSGLITKKEQRVYIKIECLSGLLHWSNIACRCIIKQESNI